jgi:chorismate mutase
MVTQPVTTDHAAGTMCVRAVRGATTVASDDPVLVHQAVTELLTTLLLHNDIETHDIISAMFTVTPDIRCTFPARAARDIGWTDVPMLCATEIDVPGAQPRCLRVLLHVERDTVQPKLEPVYLRDAVSLRADLLP